MVDRAVHLGEADPAGACIRVGKITSSLTTFHCLKLALPQLSKPRPATTEQTHEAVAARYTVALHNTERALVFRNVAAQIIFPNYIEFRAPPLV